MRVLILQDDLFTYLQHIVRSYAAAGIDPEEGMALFQLNQALKGAQVVDDNQVAKVTTGEVADTPVAAVSVEPKFVPPPAPEEQGVRKGAA
jgi:hypothetical protein